MEKRDKLKKDYTFPKRVQVSRMPEIQRSCETSKWSVKKDNQQNVNISNNLVPPQAYVGRVKKIQKIFEDIGSKDIVSHHVEPVKSINVSQREKDYVSDQEVSTAGLHRPIFSQVFNPLKKEHLEKRIEHATISVIDSSGKLHPCIITENYMDTIEDIVENNDSLGKDFAETHLSNSHEDKEAFQRHPRPTLQDLQLAPRTPTSPSNKIKNNFSFSLGSPKGWKNESAVVRPTKHFTGQIFENQRESTPVPSYKSNVFFTEENFSNSITDSDLQQKREQTNHNRVIQSQKEHRTELNTTITPNLVYDESPDISTKEKLNKSRTVRGLALLKNKIQEECKKHEDLKQTVETKSKIESDALDLENQERSAEEPMISLNTTIAPNLVYDESPAISTKEKLNKSRTVRGLALLKNKIQEEITKHEDLKQTAETKSKIESDALDLENQERSAEEPMISLNTTIAPNLVYDESPAISTKEKLNKSRTVRGLALLKNKIQEEFTKHEDFKQTVETKSKIESDALDLEIQEGSAEEPTISPNRSSKFSNKNLPVRSQRRRDFQKHISTQNKDLGSSNDSNRLRVNSDKHIIHITKDIVDDGTSEISDGTDKKSTTHNVVQNRYTALLNTKIVNNVDLDAGQLNQSKKKTEMKVSETSPINKQDLKYTVKGLSQTHQNMEMKHTSELATQINMVPTPYEDKVPDLDVDQLNQGNKKTEIKIFKKLPMNKQEREKGLSPMHQNKEIRHTHKLVSEKSTLPTAYKDKASSLIIETIRGHSKDEDESVYRKKQNTSMEPATNISTGQKIIGKLKQEISGGIKGDSSIVRDKNVEYISKAYLESTANKTFEKSRDQPATDVVSAYTEQNKSADMEKQTLPVVVPSTLVSSDQLINNFNYIEVSVTLTDVQKEASSDLVIEHPMYKPENDSATNQIEDITTQSVDINNHSGQDIPVLVTSAKHSWDPGTYRVENLINQGETYMDSGMTDDLLENATDLLAENHTEESSPHIKKSSTEGIIIKIIDMKDSIGEDFTGLTGSFDDSNKHIDCTIKEESANMSVITQDMCTQNILADSFLSGETIGHNLENQMNLGEHNVISVETKKQPEENSVFVIQNSKINKVFENVFEIKNRGMEKDVTNMKEQNVQQTIVLSAEIRDQPLEKLEKQEYLGDRRKYSSLTFLQAEDNSKLEYTTDVTVNESIDVENFRKNVENIVPHFEAVDKCFLEKPWWVKEDHRFEYKMYQVDGLLPVASTDALQDITEIETCGQGRYAKIKQSLDQVDVVSPKKPEDITEIIYKNKKTEIDNNNWTATLDQAMDECENVIVEKSEDFMDLKLTKGRIVKNGQENEDQIHITTDVRNQSQDAMDIFSANYIVGQARIEELDEDQHEGVIHGRENALDFTQEAETLATKESKHEVNHTNNKVLQPMATAVNIREHPNDNSNRELKQGLVNTVVAGQLENDTAVSQKQYLPQNLDEKLVSLQDVEGLSHLPLLELKPMDNQEKVHEHGTETSNSKASLMSSELLKAQNSYLGHTETRIDTISVTSQGDDGQSHLSLPKLITLDIQRNVDGLSTETSNSLAHVMSYEPLDVQMSYLRDTETKSVKGQSHLSLPELKTIDSKENVYEHSTETSNFIAPVMSSEPLDVQIPCLRDTVTTSHTSSVTLQSIEGPLPELKTIDNQENVCENHTKTDSSIAPLMSLEPLDVQNSYLRNTETKTDTLTVTSQGVERQRHLNLSVLKTIDIQQNLKEFYTDTSNFIAPMIPSEPLDVKITYLRDTDSTGNATDVAFKVDEGQSHLTLSDLKTIDIQENVYHLNTEASNSIAPVMTSEPSDVTIAYLRDTESTGDAISAALHDDERQSHLPLSELKTIDIPENVYHLNTEASNSIAPVMPLEPLDVKTTYLRDTESTGDAISVALQADERQRHLPLSELKTIDIPENVYHLNTEASNSIAPVMPSEPLDVKYTYLSDTESTGDAIIVALQADERQSYLPLSELKTIDISENVYHLNTEASNSIAPVIPSEPLDEKMSYLRNTESTGDAIGVVLQGDEIQNYLPLSELKTIDIPENIYHLNTEASNSIAPVIPSEQLDVKMSYLRDTETTGDTISVALQGVEVQNHLPLSELKTIDIQENLNKLPTETSNSIASVMPSEPFDLKMSCLRDKETTGDTISVALQGVERQSHIPLPELKTIDSQENKNELHTEISNFIADVIPSEPLDVKMSYLRDTETTGDTIRVALQGFEGQINIPLPELKTIDSQENIYGSYKGISNSIESLLSSEPTDIQISYSRDTKTSETIPVATKNNSGPSLNDNLQIYKDSPQTPKEDSKTAIKKNAAPCEEEEESPENMESWLNKLRQLETPEFLRYQKPRRQPHSTQHFIEITLPPIKEDQGSPKCDEPDFNWQLQEKEETLKVIITPSENNSALETKATEQSEQSEESPKKFSWERSLDKVTVRSSPLELMRKHSGEEGSRSENYKALITQSLSQRQSSIIGSLLLADRLDKKSETSEGKSFSRLESSYLLSSYLKPKKDLQQEKTDQIGLQDMSSTDSTNLHTTSDSLTISNKASDSLTSASGANTASDSLTSASGANTVSDSLTNASGANTASDSLTNASGANTASDSLTKASGANTASDSLTSASGANTVSGSLTSASGANKASDSLTSASGANTVSDSLTSASGANTVSDSLTNASGANTASDSLTKASGANTASDSLTSASGANTVSGSLTSASGANKASDSLTSALGANTVSGSLTSASGANTVSGSLTSASGASTASDSLTSASGANTVSGSLTSASGASTASDSLTSASGANTVSDSLTSASGANTVSGSLTSASGASRASDSLTSPSRANTVSDFLTSASGANTVSGSLTSVSGANAASDSLTSALGANKVSDFLTSASEANTVSGSLTSVSGANTVNGSLTSALGANTAGDSLTSASGANTVSGSLTSVSGANTVNGSLTSALGANTVSDSLTNASGANTVNGSLTSASGANAASDSLTSALGANTVSDSLTSASGVNAVSDSLNSASGANTVSDSLTSVLVSNRASDSLTSASGANAASDSLTSASGANTASDSLTSASGANTVSDSLTSASGANTVSDSLTNASGANTASDSLTNASGANTVSDSLTSASGANTVSDSLTSASGANTVSDSLTSASGANTVSDSLTNASGANTASDSLTKASGANTASDSLTSASGANTCNVSLNSSLEENTANVSLTSVSGTNTTRDSLTNTTEAGKANESLSGAPETKTTSNSLTSAQEANKTSDSLIIASGPNKAGDSLTSTSVTKTNSVTLTNASGANRASDILFNASGAQQPEDKEYSSQLQSDNVPTSDSTELLSKLEPPVASTCKVFPDVWQHPGKIHGKLNPRPGKIILFSEPGFRGHRHEIYSDVGNMSDWELQGTVSVCIVRGGWLLYEKPQFRGKRVMLTEGDTDLPCPWEVEKATSETLLNDTRKPKFWIGSLRHVVRDFQVPQISLFTEDNGEGNKVTITGATPDSRVHGYPIKTESIIVHKGLWLVYSKPFFEGDPYILEPGGYPNRKAWNGQDSHLCSLQPARIGGPTVEKPNEPKILLFKYPGFQGPVWEVSKDLNSLQDELNSDGECLLTVGSVRILGGCWVGYENKGFHGHQYLLEEGKYKDWSTWGGYSEELGSIRHICTDFSEPEIVLYEQPGCSDGPCLRLNEALSDIELAQYGTKTESIHVLNGVWVAYENVDFSGEQYILEKGIYHSYQDWGAKDSRICSVQPVLQVGGQSLQYSPKIQLFSEPNFHGDCMTIVEDHSLIPESFSLQSCRVEGGSWSLYEGENYRGEQYILSEGDYPTRTAMGFQGFSTISSLKRIPLYFSFPSISLHGLERFGGKELNFTGEVRSLQGEGYNNHVLSIKVKSGLWVLYEHSDFRGRQWLLGHTQIPNWLLYSGLQRIGSLCPIRQRRVYFRLQNRVLGLFLCVLEPTEDVKAARVHLSEPQEGCCNLWFYEDGRIKNQLVPQMSLQVVGLANQGTKVVLWSEERKPVQTWNLEDSGYIVSCLFKGLCLDIKGGHGYDSKHVVVWEVSEDRPTQRWDLKVY
ncbi:beta/gamma crystallin domain-containing protein 2 isoform X2 [Aquarana catesbeiana]